LQGFDRVTPLSALPFGFPFFFYIPFGRGVEPLGWSHQS
jgi:hypothetical protein